MTERTDRCVFRFEGGKEFPCWGDLEIYDETEEGDVIEVCQGHSGCCLSGPLDQMERGGYIAQGSR